MIEPNSRILFDSLTANNIANKYTVAASTLYLIVLKRETTELIIPNKSMPLWPAPGSEDTELGVLMEPEVGHGATEVYPGVQA